MRKIDIHLILTSTNGLFNEKQVPELYVLIQKHKAVLEAKLNKELSFAKAVHSWMETDFATILEIANLKELRAAFPNKSNAQIFFKITNRMEKLKTKDAKKAALSLINEEKAQAIA